MIHNYNIKILFSMPETLFNLKEKRNFKEETDHRSF